jgi:hypothetical protein
MARMLIRLGLERAEDLRGQDPAELYRRLYEIDGRRHDPCVLDTLTAVVDFAAGAPARPWWVYSRRRKAGETSGSGAATAKPAAPGGRSPRRSSAPMAASEGSSR